MKESSFFEKLNETLKTLREIEGDSEAIKKLENKIRGKEFNLVVIGQFKRGKSTFINALLGEKVLPTAILPLTSIVTIINYSDRAEATIVFQDNREEKVQVSEIDKYVTEKHNPENRLGVSEVLVYYPSEYLKDGIRIIDTPGVGSIFEHNTDVAYEYLPNCDAAIFMMSPDPPISKTELEFLRSAKEYIDKFFFVLNKKDIVPPEDLKDVMEFNRNLLERELNTEIRIVPISALKALNGKIEHNEELLKESNLSEVERNIIEPLKKEKWKLLLTSIINSLLRHIEGVESTFRLRQKADAMTLNELQQKIEEFRDFAKTINQYEEENSFVLKGKIGKLSQYIDEEIEKLKEQVLPALIEDTIEVFREKTKKRLKTEELDEEMKAYMIKRIRKIFTAFENQQKKNISLKVNEIYTDLGERTNRIIQRIVEEASSIFDVDLKPFVAIDAMPQKTEFSFKFNDQMEALAIIGAFIRKKLPRFLGKVVIEKHIKTSTEEIFDRHCGRVRYALLKAIEDATRRFKFELDEKIEYTIKTLQEIMDKSLKIKAENEEEVRKNALEIEENLKKLHRIKEMLINLKSQLSEGAS